MRFRGLFINHNSFNKSFFLKVGDMREIAIRVELFLQFQTCQGQCCNFFVLEGLFKEFSL